MPELPPPPSGQPSWRQLLADASARLDTGRRRALAIGGLAACLALSVVAWHAWRPPPVPIDASLPRAQAGAASTTDSTNAPEQIIVAAAGAVVAPGVYRVSADARVTDVIDAAGGPAEDADLDQLNLAGRIADGDRVYVPRIGESAVPPIGTTKSMNGAGDQVVDLNTASAADLDALPGIGPATAQAIVDYRSQHGRIRSVDELLEIRGIGPAKLDAIRTKVRAGR